MNTDRFKFRVWDKEHNKMVFFDFNNLIAFGRDLELDSNNELEYLDLDEPMQRTGLKDKNGVLIYESDIAKFTRSADPMFTTSTAKVDYKCEIRWYRNGYYFIYLDPMFDSEITLIPWNNFISNVEVIGNIHQNKELLND